MTDYLTLADLKATLDLTGETFADADITLAITAASRAIDNICERRFWLDADASSVRYYTSRTHRHIDIDDLVAITSLQTDNDGDGTFENTWTLNSDYVFEPLNAPLDGEPWTAIRRRRTGSFWLPTRVERGVKVTGQFGWAAIPTEITQAAGILASRFVRRSRESPFGIIGFGMDPSNAVTIAKNDPDVMMLVGPYVRKLLI